MQPYSPEALSEVWRRLRRHPTSGRQRETAVGVDGTRAAGFEHNLQGNLAEISRRVLRPGPDGLPAYDFAPLLRHEKAKSGGGLRLIHIPRLRDQLVLRAMHEDLIRAAATENLQLRPPPPGETVRAFRACLTPESVVLRADIHSFYDSVPRGGVVEKACALRLEASTAGLLRKWSGSVTARELWRAGKGSDRPVDGLPQGLSVSSSLAELWIAGVDREAAARWRYFRYVDDMAVVCGSVRAAEDALDWLLARLQGLGLRLSPSKTAIVPIREGVSWLGLTHLVDRAKAEAGRPERWLRRFASIRREAATALRGPAADRQQILAGFHRPIRDEISGRTSSRPAWYAEVEDDGAWREMDRSIHALIRSIHRMAGAPEPTGRHLPSVHRAIHSRRRAHRFSVPSNADPGPCATLPRQGETTADQGHKAPDGAEPPSLTR